MMMSRKANRAARRLNQQISLEYQPTEVEEPHVLSSEGGLLEEIMPESLESKSNTKKKKKKRSPSDNPSATEDADAKTKRYKQETETVESSTMSMIGDKFRAAGILFYEKRGNHCKALLGVQTKQFKLSILGGKRSKRESPVDTATREFFEETGGILHQDIYTQLQKYLQDSCPTSLTTQADVYHTVSIDDPTSDLHPFDVMWVESGQFVLFCVRIDAIPGLQQELDQLVPRFEEFCLTGWAAAPKTQREMTALVWVDWRSVLTAVQASAPGATPTSFPSFDCDGALATTSFITAAATAAATATAVAAPGTDVAATGTHMKSPAVPWSADVHIYRSTSSPWELSRFLVYTVIAPSVQMWSRRIIGRL